MSTALYLEEKMLTSSLFCFFHGSVIAVMTNEKHTVLFMLHVMFIYLSVHRFLLAFLCIFCGLLKRNGELKEFTCL